LNGITCERRVYNSRPNTHAHSYAQLILPLAGRLDIETSQRKLSLGNGKIFYLPPECSHTFSANNTNEFLVLDIPDNLFARNDPANLAGDRELLLDDKWKAIAYLLLQEADENKNTASLINLFSYAYRLISQDYLPVSVKYINENYAEDLDLNMLAALEHYNAGYYGEWFRNIMKVTPAEYIRDLRVRKARELLLNTGFSVLQIAQMVGYKHNSSFTRVFKDAEKTTPAGFRKKHGNS
jgi:AraC-like DNA-binding protein